MFWVTVPSWKPAEMRYPKPGLTDCRVENPRKCETRNYGDWTSDAVSGPGICVASCAGTADEGLRSAAVNESRRWVGGTQNNQREEAAAPTPNRQRIRGVRMSERKRMNELPRSMADEERGASATNPSQDNKLAMRKHGQPAPMWRNHAPKQRKLWRWMVRKRVRDGFLRQQETGLCERMMMKL